MPKRKKKDEWLNEVPAHLRPHLQKPVKEGSNARKPVGGLKPRPARSASEARRFAQAVEQRIELMKKEQEWDTNALARIPVQVEMVVEDTMGGEPQPVEWADEKPERYEVVDEGEAGMGDEDEEETAGEVTGEVTGEVPDQNSEEWLTRSHEERIEAIDEEEACAVMLTSHSYYEAAERLRLTIGELKALRRRKKFNELYTQRYEAAKKAEPRPYAIKPYQYWEDRSGNGPLQLRMDEIILTLIQYPTIAQAAKKLGIKPSTLDLLRRDPRFQVRFHERRQEALALGTLILQMNYSKINQELLAMAFDPEVPAVVRANISLQLSKRVEDQIEKEQNNERMVKQLEEYKAVIERAGKGSVDEVTVEGEEK